MNENKILQLEKRDLKYAVEHAKIDFDSCLCSNDKVVAVDGESPFIVLIKKEANKFCWVIDFLVSERVKEYSKIPRVNVSDYFKMWRMI